MSMFPVQFGSAYWLGALGVTVKANPVAPEERAAPEALIERSQISSGMIQFSDYCGNVPPPNYGTYRRHRTTPIVTFASGLVIDPIKAGTRTLVIRNADGTSASKRSLVPTGSGVQVLDAPEDKRKKRDEDVYEGHWADILDSLEAINFGNWPQEVEWDSLPKFGVVGPKRFKSFLPWEVDYLKDKYNDFAGIKVGQQERDPRYVWNYVYGRKFDPIFGWPRAADARISVHRIMESHANTDKLENKASGIQMMIGIAAGMTFKDANGNVVTHDKIIETVRNAATTGKTWTYPLMAFDLPTLKEHPELAKVQAMVAEKFDWGDSGPSIIASISRRAELKVEVVNAYCRPEREGMEGTHGTKAEAGVHGAVGIRDSEGLGNDFYRQFNKGHYNRYLVTNDGPDAADSMYWEPSPLADPQQAFKQSVVTGLLANPATAPIAEAMIDLYALIKSTELPTVPAKQIKLPPPMPTGPDPNAGVGGGRMGNMAGANGNGSGN